MSTAEKLAAKAGNAGKSERRLRTQAPRPPADQRPFWYEDEMAALMEIDVETLRNRIYRGKDHPPVTGSGHSKRFYKDDFTKWDKSRQKAETSSGK